MEENWLANGGRWCAASAGRGLAPRTLEVRALRTLRAFRAFRTLRPAALDRGFLRGAFLARAVALAIAAAAFRDPLLPGRLGARALHAREQPFALQLVVALA